MCICSVINDVLIAGEEGRWGKSTCLLCQSFCCSSIHFLEHFCTHTAMKLLIWNYLLSLHRDTSKFYSWCMYSFILHCCGTFLFNVGAYNVYVHSPLFHALLKLRRLIYYWNLDDIAIIFIHCWSKVCILGNEERHAWTMATITMAYRVGLAVWTTTPKHGV